ncbi:hypothetical protein F5J12DRAFT_951863 [Pisolithus orientalis]|uniref:uncharacterized protein n=1 Tax=Pisolithus orientalis TaxID=936130 RepID=UPI00222540DB|nr:uncharacterized protein F5J12DRAFT_951863 [Pisolithus orientalis]KAI5999831.1 hypothetical protein F5J12DRAFT_951863 [Pisolithus orientalis]
MSHKVIPRRLSRSVDSRKSPPMWDRLVSTVPTSHTMTTVWEEELQALYTGLYQIRLVNYVTLSCIAFLVHDILTNLDKEIPFIWRYYHNTDETFVCWHRRLRRMLVQGLFIFGRYYAIFYLVCKGFYYYTIFGGEILYTTLVNVILAMRLNVLFRIFYGIEGLQKYQFFLATLVIVEFLVELVIGILVAIWIQEKVVEPPAGVPWPGCMLTTLFGFTLHLLFSSMRWRLKSFRDLTISNIKEEIKSLQPTTLMLIRDGALFYIPMCAMLLASVVVDAIDHNFLSLVTSPIVMVLYSFCSSRFIIHTRECIAKSAGRCQVEAVEQLHLSTLSHGHR